MEVLIGKSSMNGQFSMAMLNNQRVYNTYIYVGMKQKMIKATPILTLKE